MRGVWALLILLPAFAGCLSEDGDPIVETRVEPEPIELANTTAIHIPGQERLSPTNLSNGTLAALATARGTYYSIGAPTFEPTIGTTSSGAIFMIAFGDTPGTHILRSRDQGQSWEDVTPMAGDSDVEQTPNSNDPYLYVDPWTDRLIKFDMHALACMTLETSDDEGESWSVVTPACGQPVGGAHDHQSIASAPAPEGTTTVGYPNVMVYCVNRGPNIAGSWCSSSLDGGLSWTPLVPGYPAGTPQCYGAHGHLVGDDDGRIYRPGHGCDGATVWRSEDGGFTWTEHPIPGTSALTHEVAVAVDSNGSIHAFWIDGGDGLPRLASSSDHGDTWGPVHQVAAPGITAAGFPTIAAGDGVAFAYIGTTEEDGYGNNNDEMEWSGYIGTTLDAFAAAPTFATVAVNAADDPLHVGPCGDRRCGGFGDFIDIAIDPDGRPWAAMAWDEQEFEPIADNVPVGFNTGPVIGLVGTLAEGPALRGNGTLEPIPLGGPSTR